jgi:hypothetical protein
VTGPVTGPGDNGPAMTSLLLVPMHLGALHPYEKLVVALIAFGPFVVLFVVVHVVRRRDIAEEEARRRAAPDPRTGQQSDER